MGLKTYWRSCAASVVLMTGTAAASSAQALSERLGPDFLNTLGVGSRAVAMGNAYSAIADDASATFWNPARLSVIQKRQFMLDYRSVVHSRASQTNVGIPAKTSVADPQLSFVSFVYPLVQVRPSPTPDDPERKVSRNWGTIGFSYTLGGYFNYELATSINDTGGGSNAEASGRAVQTGTFNNVIRNEYITVSYGIQGNPKSLGGATVGLGLGYYRLNHSQSRITVSETIPDQGSRIRTETREREKGDADGYLIGFTYRPRLKQEDAPWYLGICYRSGATIGGLTDVGRGFGNEVPDRLSIGLAYNFPIQRNLLIVSTEGQFFSSANKPGQTDERKAITNFHLGMEFVPERPLFTIPGVASVNAVRLGFRTNANAAKNYTNYDNVVSLGFALQRKDGVNLITSLEPAIEILTGTGDFQWTLTGIVRF